MSKRKTKHKRIFATAMIKECVSCKGKTDIQRVGDYKHLVCQSCGRDYGEILPPRQQVMNNKHRR